MERARPGRRLAFRPTLCLLGVEVAPLRHALKRGTNERMRTLALGFDGCSWNVLEPLLETGELPNLAALRGSGRARRAREHDPLLHRPGLGVVRDRLPRRRRTAIYDFMMLREDGELCVARHDDLRRKTYYQQLGDEGKSSVLINLPIDQDGCEGAVIVNSWLTDDGLGGSCPSAQQALCPPAVGVPDVSQNPCDIDELCEIEQARFDLARELFLGESWDHFFVPVLVDGLVGPSGDRLRVSGRSRGPPAFLRLYSQLDRYVGWLVEHAPDATVALLSDHGQCEEEAVLRVNTVLVELGFARLAHGPRERR